MPSLGIVDRHSHLSNARKVVSHSNLYELGGEAVSSTTKIPIPRSKLICLNLTMFLFHTLLAFVTLFFGNVDLKAPLYKTDMNFTIQQNTTPAWDLVPTYEYANVDFYFTVITSIFFIISAVFHLGNATLWKHFYFAELQECRVPTRWIEYFFSASVMMLLLAYGAGIRDVMLLVAVASLVATTIPFGHWTEVCARPKNLDEWTLPLSQRLLPYALGHFPQIVAWGIVLFSVYDESDIERIPSFVLIIIWSQLLLFFSFGMVQLWQQSSKPRAYVKGEVAYQFLSLISKGVLGGLLIANVLVLSNYNEIFD